jgi:hypothetical protein
MLHLMPTLNPRVSITLTPAVSAVLKEMSKLTGNSQSAIVGELLETSLPVFERVCTILRAAASVQESAKSEIAAGLDRAQSRLEEQIGLQLSDFDEIARPLLDAAEKVDRRPGVRAQTAGSTRPTGRHSRIESDVPKKGTRTPVSNRGVTPSKSTDHKAKKTTARGVR